MNPGIVEEIENQKLDLLGVVPQDDLIYDYDCAGKPTVTLPEDTPAHKAFLEMIQELPL